MDYGQNIVQMMNSAPLKPPFALPLRVSKKCVINPPLGKSGFTNFNITIPRPVIEIGILEISMLELSPPPISS